MLSTISPSEPLFGTPYTAVHGGFPPWDHVESPIYPSFDHQLFNPSPSLVNNEIICNSNPTRYHAGLDSGSDNQGQNKIGSDQAEPNPNQTNSKSNLKLSGSGSGSGSGSDDPNKDPTGSNPGSCSNDSNQNSTGSNTSSGSDESSRLASIMNERKRKRMISNRESARRSRWRKQRHLEDLRNTVNNLKIENRKHMNQFRFFNHYNLLIRRENNRLMTESIILQRRLMELVRISKLQQLQRNLSSSSSSSIPMHGHANIGLSHH